MGFLTLAVVFAAIVAVVNLVFVLSPLGRPRQPEKVLNVTVPEDLEFDGMFDETLARHASEYELTEVQTTNMGSLFQLTYRLRLRDESDAKALIDEVRRLNGNLKVTFGLPRKTRETL